MSGCGAWVDYWAVDFNYESRRGIIKVPKGTGVNVVQGHLPGQEPDQRELELTTAAHTYTAAGRYTIAVNVIDILATTP